MRDIRAIHLRRPQVGLHLPRGHTGYDNTAFAILRVLASAALRYCASLGAMSSDVLHSICFAAGRAELALAFFWELKG